MRKIIQHNCKEKSNGYADSGPSVGERHADSASFRQLENEGAGRHVLDREPDGLEKGDVRRLAVTGRPGDDVTERFQSAPSYLALSFGQDHVAGFEAGGIDV